MANKNITLYEEGSNKTVEVYPKTVISQVNGLQAALAQSGIGEVSTVDGYDFAGAQSLENGSYFIKNPVNSPFGGENGFMNVSTETGSRLESWISEHFAGYKILSEVNPITNGFSSLKINNTAVDVSVNGSPLQGVQVDINAVIVKDLDYGAEVILAPGGEYTLSGALINTRIRIAAGESTASTITTLNFDGLYVYFNNFIDTEDEDNLEKRAKGWEPMIQSDAAGKTVINLVEGSNNYLVREKAETMQIIDDATGLYGANTSTGVIYSSNGTETLEIKGTGFLSIKTMLGGHAIKSKGNLLLNGTPKIRATAYHDILHGNASVTVNGGYVYTDWCNDFFGADTADGDQAVGLITINSGDFYIKFCNETFLQGDNARVFPTMKLTFEHIGEGLWLQCKPGTRLFVEDGKVKGYFSLNYSTHTFVYNEIKKAGMKKVAGWGQKEFWTPLDFNAHSDPYAALSSIPEGSDTRIVHTNSDVYGIITYTGVDANITGLTSSDDYYYSEGNKGRTTARATQAASETAAPANENVAMPVLSDYAEVFPIVELNEYTGTVVAGKWVIYTNIEKLNSEKNALTKSIKALLASIVPVKTLSISAWRHGAMLTKDDSATPVPFISDGTAIAVNTAKAIAAEKEVFTSKNGNVPVIKLRKGEWARIYAHVDPADATNLNLKWSCAYENENTVIYIRKSEDTQYCDVLGLDNGAPEGQIESVILSAKGLDKNGGTVKMKISFHVVPQENDYTLVDLPDEKSELEVIREDIVAAESRANSYTDGAIYNTTETMAAILSSAKVTKFTYGMPELAGAVTDSELEPAVIESGIMRLSGILNQNTATISPTFAPVLENYFVYNLLSASVMLRFEILEGADLTQFAAPQSILENFGLSAAYILPITIADPIDSDLSTNIFMGHIPVYKEHQSASGTAMYVDGSQMTSVFFLHGMCLISAPLPAGKYWLQGTLISMPNTIMNQFQALAETPEEEEGE